MKSTSKIFKTYFRRGLLFLVIIIAAVSNAAATYDPIKSFGFSAESGQSPYGIVIEGGDGALYGTTYRGCSSGLGTVFRLSKNGSGYAVLTNFTGVGGDGSYPYATLVESAGALYGTTQRGGSYGLGTVFRLNKDGSGYTVVKNFTVTTQTQQSYPFVCRGATSATISFKPERKLVLKFIKGTAPADSRLAPGECSWTDRGMSASEPDMLVQQVPEQADEQPEYKWASQLKDADTYWSFDVYNDGQGQLIVTGSRRKSARRTETVQATTGPGPDSRLQAVLDLPTVRSVRPSCTGDQFATLVICTTKGDCFTSQHPCFPYQCNSSTKTCATSCAGGAGCAPGMTCVDGTCVYPRTFCKDARTSANLKGETRDCHNYSCNWWSGLCHTVCESESDCAPRHICSSNRVCIPDPYPRKPMSGASLSYVQQ